MKSGPDAAAGAKLAITTALLVLLVSAVQLVVGNPIALFGSKPMSLAYLLVVYLPVIVVCVLAYRKLEQL